MNQSSRNREFVKNNLKKCFDDMILSDKLLNRLYADEANPFFDLMTLLKDLKDKSAKKMFIIMQYTKERYPADYLAQVLKDCGQTDIALKIIEFNRTEGFFNYEDKDALTVRKSVVKNSAISMCYPMDATPRGVCIIILNESQLEREAHAFEYVFEQLYFKVKYRKGLTAQQIRQLFSKVADNQKYKDMNALITVAIGHGEDECFLGERFDFDPTDKVPIVDLVNTFDDNKCQVFKDKPKIHLFNCCRRRTVSVDQNIRSLQHFDLAQCFNKNWQNINAHTTVIYSCSEGFKAFFDPKFGFSYFGRAFIYTFAQFVYEYHLDQILNKVNLRMERENLAEQKPQVVKHYCTLNLYFNPKI